MKKLWEMILQEEEGEGAPTGGGAEDPTPQGEPEPTPEPQLTPEQQKLAKLELELAELKNKQQPAPTTPQPITSAQLESYSEEHWAMIEQRTGRTKDQIIRDYKDHEITQRQQAIEAKSNTADALNDAIEANPKLTKLRGTIKEYLEDVPAADKLDPVKLKKHMDKAIIYAKGKHMTNTPEPTTPRNVRPNDNPSPKGGGVDDEPGDDTVEGEIKSDEYVSETGLRIRTGKVDKERWKQIRSKTRGPNSVTIPSDFDKPPQFSR